MTTLSSSRAWRGRYSVALGLIAVLSVSGFVGVRGVTANHRERVALVNTSGRQRMLLQRTALEALRLTQVAPEEQSAGRVALFSTLEELESVHEALLQTDAAHAEGVAELYFVPPHRLDRELRAFIMLGQSFAGLPEAELRLEQPALQRILSLSSGSLLTSLDTLVERYALESDIQLQRLEQLEGALFLLTLLVLAGEACLIFLPLERRLWAGERALLGRKAYFEGLVQRGFDPILLLDAAGRVQYASPALGTLLGYRPEWVLGREPTFLLHPEERPWLLHLFRRLAQREGATSVRTLRIQSEAGAWRSFEVRFRNLLADPFVRGVVLNCRDVTERQEQQEALAASNAALQRAGRLKDEFLANMSHELRTPLTAIIGFAELLKEGVTGALTPKQQRYSEDIFTAGQHLLSLINDLLDLSKLEAGKLSLTLEPLSLADLCERVLLLLRDRAARSGIRLEAELAALPDLQLDERKMKQILFNLLSNALKFTPAGGMVTLRLREEGEGFILEVQDSGIGIAPEDQRRLFQPFVQLDNALKRQHEGSGLGLALTKHLVALHGGSISLLSQPGRGSLFRVSLPKGLAVLPPADVTEHPTILVIEDDDRSARLLHGYLEGYAARCLRARNGQEGLELLQRERPDLVLLDLMMPVMDGYAFLRARTADPAVAEIPVVILSALDAVEDDPSVSAVLTKPLSRNTLLETLSRVRGEQPQTVLLADSAGAILPLHPSCKLLRAETAAQMQTLFEAHAPDVLILDLSLPDLRLRDWLERFCDPTCSAAILIVTGRFAEDETQLPYGRTLN